MRRSRRGTRADYAPPDRRVNEIARRSGYSPGKREPMETARGGALIGKLALAVFVLSCSAVGLRLVWIAARDQVGPALSCGLGFTFIALVGQPLSAMSGSYTGTTGEINHGLSAAGILFVCAGLSS